MPPLTHTHAPFGAQVRLEFLRTLRDWTMRLRERMDHEQRLLPYILGAVDDEAAVVQVWAGGTGVDTQRRALHPVRSSLGKGAVLPW